MGVSGCLLELDEFGVLRVARDLLSKLVSISEVDSVSFHLMQCHLGFFCT